MYRKLSLSALLIFIAVFFYFYCTSGKFKSSIKKASLVVFAATTILGSAAPDAKAQHSVHGFAPKDVPSRVEPNRQLFNGDGGGSPDSPDDGNNGGISGLPGSESLSQASERQEDMQQNLEVLSQESDSESDESDVESEIECKDLSTSDKKTKKDYRKNNKKIAGITDSFEKSKGSGIKQATRHALKNARVMKELYDVKKNLSDNVDPMEIGRQTEDLGNGFFYIRKSNSRIVVKIDPVSKEKDIVAVANRDNAGDMESFAKFVNKQPTNKKINPKAY